MSDENLALTFDILDKLGISTDSAGTATLFSRLVQIAGYTDTLKTLLGTANPASGDLTTTFKALKLIADYVDTLEAKTGANTDGAGTTTLFARLTQIAQYTDTIETIIGPLLDAANPTGSANAKLAAVLQRLGGGTPNIFNQAVLTSNLEASPSTILNITGSGAILGFSAKPPGWNQYMRIVIDGVERFNGMLKAQGDDYRVLFGPLKFNTSFFVSSYMDSSEPLDASYLCTFLTGVA